jgi:hypothetical protein
MSTTLLVVLVTIGMVVTAIAAVAVVVIVSCLVLLVARRAIDKTTPESVPSVVRELASLIGRFQGVLPWSGKELAGAEGRKQRTAADEDTDRPTHPGGGGQA